MKHKQSSSREEAIKKETRKYNANEMDKWRQRFVVFFVLVVSGPLKSPAVT